MSKSIKNNLIISILLLGLVLIPSFDLVKADSPNLSLTKSVDKTQVNPGEILTFTLSYQNTGSESATGVKLIDDFSQTYLEVYDAGNGSVSGGRITWDIGTLAANGSGSKTFKLKVKGNISDTVQLFNTAVLNSNETNSVQSNTVKIIINQTPPPPILFPNLSLAKSVDKTQVNPGEILTFTLSYQNTGSGSATGVKLIDDFSQTYLEVYDAGNGSVSGGRITWDIGTLAANGSGSKTFKLKVKGNISDTVQLFNTAVLNSNETNSVQSNTVKIIINASPQINNPPVANAGPDKEIEENQSVILNGSGSDPDNDSITYSWTCPEGILSNANISQPTYTAPLVNIDTSYTCILFVKDSKGLSNADSMIILIKDKKIPAPTPLAPTSTPAPTPVPAPTPIPINSSTDNINLKVEKTVKNLSRKDVNWLNEISASSLDIIEFRIEIISNSNIKLKNVMVKDDLPLKILYQANLKIDNVSDPRNISSQAIDIGDLNPGQTKIITFEGQIASENNFDFGTTKLANNVFVYNSNISKTDDCAIIIRKTGVAGVSTGIVSDLLLNSILLPLTIICLFLAWIFRLKLLNFYRKVL